MTPECMYMFLYMDFRITALIHFLVFYLSMYKDFHSFFSKTVQMLSEKFKHVLSVIMAVFFSSKLKKILGIYLCMNLEKEPYEYKYMN